MKKILLSVAFIILVLWAFSAPFKFLPHKITQPDGTVIECFLSGDEFFNWIHDKDGYSILKGKDGYFYYAVKEKENIVASSFKVGSSNPEQVGLKKWTIISKEEYDKRRELFNLPSKEVISNAPHAGQLNNLVIYIKFSGESEFSTTREEYDDKLNAETGVSLKAYYNEVSYNNLTINSTHYPNCASPSTTNASYVDSHTREYFQAYDATTNPIGYNGDTERTEREHQLLADAVAWINANYPVDADLDIDGDDDGYVDNVCFMINGNSDGWNSLLWAHRWSLYTKTVYINGKRVYGFTFQPENQVDVNVLCHEMFHALGAPDLYHYYNGTNLDPVSYWDLMESGSGHMSAYMKYMYADQNWIADIPEITSAGTYTLNPLTSSTNNCYKIASPYSTEEFFVLEYRKRSGNFESNLPGDGLLVFRINTNFSGNAQYDGSSVFDEVYIYRPGGTTIANGSPSSANFSSDVSRAEINDATNPSSFLTNGNAGGLDVFNITSSGSTISFDVRLGAIDNPSNFIASAISTDEVDLTWDLNTNNDDVIIAYSLDGTFGIPEEGTSYNSGDNISGGGEVIYNGNGSSYSHLSLTSGQEYYYRIWSVNTDTEYSLGVSKSVYISCEASLLPITEDFSSGSLPSCWQNKDNNGFDQVWEFDNPAGRTFSSTSSSNGFAILDSDNYGDGNSQDADLITPLLDLSIYSEVNLKFEHYYRDWDTDYVELLYSTDNGQNWTTLQSWTIDEGTSSVPAIFDMDVTDQIAGKSEVKIKWKYVGSYGYYWIVDDIEITGVSSGNPSVITKYANDISIDLATLNGTINANDNNITDIQFEYGTESGSYTSTIDATPNTASGLTNTQISAELTGLEESTEYFYRLKCKNGLDVLNGEEKSFITESLPEPIVTTNNADGIEIDLATLHGTVNANANSVTEIEFEYGIESGNYQSTLTATPSVASGTTTTPVSIEITGLTSNTEYFYRLACTNGIEVIYGNEKSFTTEAFPTVSITSNESDFTNLSPIELEFTFSEEIATLIESDLTVTNGSVTNIVKISNTVYDVEVTPTNDGEVSIKLEENAVEDLGGYGNVASSVFTITYDGTLPEVVISSEESTTTRISPIPLTFTFNEEVTGFAVSDITVTNGAAGNLVSTSSVVYNIDITPYNGGNVTVKLKAGTVYDIAENSNLISDVWTIYYSSPTGIEKLTNAGIKLYPNPTNGLMSVEYEKPFNKGEIKIFDNSGRLVYQKELETYTIQNIDLTNQAKGNYIIQFIIDQEQISTTLILQ